MGRALRAARADSDLRRLFANASLLLGGRTIRAAANLGATVVAVKAAGLEGFGFLVLVQTFARVVSDLTRFQSWQALLRYGAPAVKSGDREAFARLLGFTFRLDILSATVGALLVLGGAPYAGRLFGWPEDIVGMAQIYAVAVFFMANATMRGTLLLFNRFDLLAVQSTAVALLRLVGATAVLLAAGPLVALVAVWFLSTVAAGLLMAFFSLRELAHNGYLRARLGMPWAGLREGHDGIWPFVLVTNLNANVALAVSHAGTLLAGALIDAASAGLFRIAREFANALSQPADLLTSAIYPEYARLAAAGHYGRMRRLLFRVTTAVGAGLLAVIVAVLLFGDWLMVFTAGEAGRAGYPLLVALSLAAVLVLWSVPLEPMLVSVGRQNIVLGIRSAEAAIFLGVSTVLLLKIGLIGAGIGAVIARFCAFLLLLLGVIRWFRGRAVPAITGADMARPEPP